MAVAVSEAFGARSPAVRDTGNLLTVLLLAGGCLNGLLVRISEAWQMHGLESPLMGISPFEILAIVIGARAILASGPAVSALAPWPELALGAAMLAPSSAVAWVAVAAYALLGAAQSQGERRAGFLLFLALAACSIWSSVLLKALAGPVAALDARAVWGILTWFRNDMVLTGNVVGVPTGHNLIILTACTSASVMPKALLGVAALTMLAGGRSARRLGLATAGVAAVCIAINLLRLTLMASSGDLYALVHGPIGANVFDAAQMLAAAGFGLWAVRS